MDPKTYPNSNPKNVRFDIIMPIHMMESVYVLRAIDSIFNQSHRKWRLTIVESLKSFEDNDGEWKAFVELEDDSRLYHCVENKTGYYSFPHQ